MQFELKEAAKASVIKEFEWGRHDEEVMFTKFTSCIGVCAKITQNGKSGVIGVHLAQSTRAASTKGHDSQEVTGNDMLKVKQLFTRYDYDPNSVMLIGEIGSWEKSRSKPLDVLRTLFRTKLNGREYRLVASGLGAKLDDDGGIEPHYQA